ncbi:LETM1-related biofilm-associated protein [Flavobacterium aciduliphilum]|uniref:LETM1-like protein n=1 Tax=Flavobacterium aciduliphilum TaxID=1101402 RepID=A0A328Y7G5_9FLAO|nr:LETM1-related biofilm-associated protein [Flavobacterium aciduliphilum]RAR70031.1 LETM1-like protein [Flavobacterium aciduliphilum]
MINPSINGWIDKFLYEKKTSFSYQEEEALSFYKKNRATGFIYGHMVSIPSFTEDEIENWDSEEVSKIALLNALFEIYYYTTHDYKIEDFSTKLLEFYELTSQKRFDLLPALLHANVHSKLENILNERVQTNKDIISKNFSHIVTNALLFIDVLAFHRFLKIKKISAKYFKNIEETIMSLVSLSLQIKSNKSQQDNLLIKLFEASVRYTKFSKITVNTLESLPLSSFELELERFYLFDITNLMLWSDFALDNEELYFLYTLAQELHLDELFVTESIETTSKFITLHKEKIQYFNYSNPVKHFYNQTNSVVKVLIKRNKKRLVKEISESKELMYLLKQSVARDLTDEEKKKVKKQILDICKGIPSLTIFLLPGGSLLLPILIKFIPKLLPSAFNENLDD